VAAAFIAGICILSTSASAGNLGPRGKMRCADPVYGSTKKCVAGGCTLKGSGGGPQKTCSAYAAICTKNLGGSPKCAAARASCMQTRVYQGPSGRVFYGMVRQ
jgi:hypothetical protein